MNQQTDLDHNTFRTRLKTSLASALFHSGVDKFIADGLRGARPPLVVGYHRVVEDFRTSSKKAIPAMLIDTGMLERHLDWIGQRFEFTNLDEIGASMRAGLRKGRPLAAVTFDDGYRDFYEHAYPLLKRKGIPAAVFVVTDMVGTTNVLLHDELHWLMTRAFKLWQSPWKTLLQPYQQMAMPPASAARLPNRIRTAFQATRALLETMSQADLRAFAVSLHGLLGDPSEESREFRTLDWDVLREMQHDGVTVGSHTRSHVLLAHEGWQKKFDETQGSKLIAERQLGTTLRHFAYPDGDFNGTAVAAVAAAGYEYAYTTCRHRDLCCPLLTIPRRVLWQRSSVDVDGNFSPATFECQISGVFDLISGCARRHLA
jgi:peptidoglycan/xylan/chitin deacetylase (PgdA/CDA1 family)